MNLNWTTLFKQMLEHFRIELFSKYCISNAHLGREICDIHIGKAIAFSQSEANGSPSRQEGLPEILTEYSDVKTNIVTNIKL